MEKIHIFVDSGNFYHLVLKKLSVTELQFDYEKFANFLANGRKISDKGKRFYAGTVPGKAGNKHREKAMAHQTSLFTALDKAGWEIKPGKLKTRIEELKIDERVEDYQRLLKLGIKTIRFERLREKGIDVKLATDLIVGAVDDQYDLAIIVSSDGDLIPAIDWVRMRRKRKVEYVGFSIPDLSNPKSSTTPLLSMISKTDIQRTLIESDLRPFIKPSLV